jgi:hypothetical protein
VIFATNIAVPAPFVQCFINPKAKPQRGEMFVENGEPWKY